MEWEPQTSFKIFGINKSKLQKKEEEEVEREEKKKLESFETTGK